ncbi:MAG TPA: XdhC family protein, partial [Acidimicrobiales bacterium]
MDAQQVGKAVHSWLAGGRTAAIARVIEVRGLGSAAQGELFALNDAGGRAGELLGGAVAGPVSEAAVAILDVGSQGRIDILDLRIDNADAARAGLSCGGGVRVVVQSTAGIPGQFWSALAEQRPVALSTVIDPVQVSHESLVTIYGAGSFGSLGDPDLNGSVEDIAGELLASAESATRTSDHTGNTVLIEAFVPEPRVVVVGGGTLADAIVGQAAILGWGAVVAEDEGSALEALDRAGASAAVVMLSHNADLDAPVLADAMKRDVGYLGALGSRRTQQHRADRLRGLGVPDADIERIHGPVGLDLGG